MPVREVTDDELREMLVNVPTTREGLCRPQSNTREKREIRLGTFLDRMLHWMRQRTTTWHPKFPHRDCTSSRAYTDAAAIAAACRFLLAPVSSRWKSILRRGLLISDRNRKIGHKPASSWKPMHIGNESGNVLAVCKNGNWTTRQPVIRFRIAVPHPVSVRNLLHRL